MNTVLINTDERRQMNPAEHSKTIKQYKHKLLSDVSVIHQIL